MNKIIELLIKIKRILTLDKCSIRGFIIYIFILITILFFKIYNKNSFNKKIKNLYISDKILDEKYKKKLEENAEKNNKIGNNY